MSPMWKMNGVQGDPMHVANKGLFIMYRPIKAALLSGLLIVAATPGLAATADPDDDFIATYVGPPNQELDLRSVSVRLEGAVFKLSATVDGAIGQDSSSYFVWGINRGSGAPRVPIRPDLNFDAIFIAYADQSAEYSLLPPPNFVDLPGVVQISGDTMSASLPLALLPSIGFAPTSYQFTVWTHYAPLGPIGVPNNAQIADFSPTIFAEVPEPASWAFMIAGFGLIGAARRRARVRSALSCR